MVGVQIILGDSPYFHRFPKLVVLDHAISPPSQIYLTFPYYPHKIRNSIVFVYEHYQEGRISLHYLSNGFIDDIYDTLQGSLIPEFSIPGVKNMFLEGSPCDAAYCEMHEAYSRLLSRLHEKDEDLDVEIIISSLLSIARILGKEMYRHGAEFALRSINAN